MKKIIFLFLLLWAHDVFSQSDNSSEDEKPWLKKHFNVKSGWGYRFWLVRLEERFYIDLKEKHHKEIDVFKHGKIGAPGSQILSIDAYHGFDKGFLRLGVNGSLGHATTADQEEELLIWTAGGFIQFGRAIRIEGGIIKAFSADIASDGRQDDRACYIGLSYPYDLIDVINEFTQ